MPRPCSAAAPMPCAVDNPISSEMTHLRPDLLPGLLRAAARNQARGFMDLALFEIGPAFQRRRTRRAAPASRPAFWSAHAAPRDPHGSRRPVDVFDAKADAEAVLAALGAPARVQITRKVPAWWHPGRSGAIGLGPNVMATFRRGSPQRPAGDGRQRPRRGLHRPDRQCPAAQGENPDPPRADHLRPASGGPRLCLRRGRKGRSPDRRQRRAWCRQGPDRKRPRLRPVHRRQGRGADGCGQEVHRPDRAAATHRQNPDRSRDRGRLRQDHREGHKRPPAAPCAPDPLQFGKNTPAGGSGGGQFSRRPPTRCAEFSRKLRPDFLQEIGACPPQTCVFSTVSSEFHACTLSPCARKTARTSPWPGRPPLQPRPPPGPPSARGTAATSGAS